MNTQLFQIQKRFPFTQPITQRMGQVMNLFGMTLRGLERLPATHTLDIQLRPGDICYITGPSGAGKSVLLRELADSMPQHDRICLEEIPLETDQSLIDSTCGPLETAVKTFNKVGLADVFAMLQPPALLSTGQQFRYRLAKALLSERPVVFADEFMSSVQTRAAMNICLQLRVLANRTKQIFILAGVHDAFIPELQPDVIVIKSATRPTQVIWQKPKRIA